MYALALTYPAIDPVAISFGPIAVRWYGLAYMAGLLLGWLYIRHLLGKASLWGTSGAPIKTDATDDLLLYMTFGIVVGGRLGHVLFYQFGYYWTHPTEILKLWHGGMSFHGGLVGGIFVVWLFSRLKRVPMLSIGDLASAAVPLGIFFGRIANFINAEHFGRPSSVPWAMVFPGGGPAPRHPSQLYEAALEGIAIFIILRFLTHRRLALQHPGWLSGAFLACYAIARIICEFFRQPDTAAPFELPPLTTGMAYSLPMLIAGLLIVRFARRGGRAATQ